MALNSGRANRAGICRYLFLDCQPSREARERNAQTVRPQMPKIISEFRYRRCVWLTTARLGSGILELIQLDSAEARRVLEALTHSAEPALSLDCLHR